MESVEEGGLDLRWCRKANLKDGETKQLPGSSRPATLGSVMADFDTGKAADQSLGGRTADARSFVPAMLKCGLTGGANTAALSMIMNLITLYLQADAIKTLAQTLVQASDYIGTYLSQGRKYRGAGVKKTAGAGVQGIKCLLKSGAKLASRSGSMNIRRDQESAKKAHEGLKSRLTGSSEA